MTDIGISRRQARPTQQNQEWTALNRQGLALRFVLIIGDLRLAQALQVVCDRNTVTVVFPETSVRVDLSRLSPGEGGSVILNCRAAYRSGTRGPYEAPRTWRRILVGRPGALHQREALLREILAARSRAPGRTVVRPNLALLRYLAAAV
ncbi:hypothetical protein ACW4TU_45665 (plasmid) [Streptomyces sp. QTS52]